MYVMFQPKAMTLSKQLRRKPISLQITQVLTKVAGRGKKKITVHPAKADEKDRLIDQPARGHALQKKRHELGSVALLDLTLHRTFILERLYLVTKHVNNGNA
jgi:hypothetical protein